MKPFLLTICKYLLIIVLATLKLTVAELQSPCPNVFQYQYDNKNTLIGLLQVSILNNYESNINLDVQISVGNQAQEFHGNIELLIPQSEVFETLRQNKPLLYRIRFPFWESIPPAITRIAVNGNQICYGLPIDTGRAPVVTTIELHHALKMDMSQRLQAPSESLSQMDVFEAKPSENIGFSRFNTAPYVPQNRSPGFSNFQNPGNQVPTASVNKNNQNNVFVYAFNDPSEITQRPVNQPNTDKPAVTNNDFVYTFGNIFQNSNNVHITVDKPAFGNNFQNNGFVYTYGDSSVLPQQTVDKPINAYKPPKTTQPIPTTVKPVTSSVRTTQSPRTTQATIPPPLEIDIRTQGPNTITSIKQLFPDICGLSVRSNSLLVNANPVSKIHHPWLAAMFKQSSEGLKFICGSTLISKKHIITAAHCVRSKIKKSSATDIWIVLGRENIQRWSSDGSQTLQAESLHVHPDYVPNKADADIAIAVLIEEVSFSSLIRPACLWTGDTDVRSVFNKFGTVVGWGRDGSGKLYTPEPRQFDFPIIEEEACLRSNPAFIGITSNRTFCGGYRNNTGPCNGDSGSGFYMKVGGRWTIRGMVSTALLRDDNLECDLEQYVVYTDVVQFSNWVFSFIIS